jgi:heat shock protein HslJ
MKTAQVVDGVPKKLAYLLLGALILSLPACGAMDAIPLPGGNGAESSLVNTRWSLVSYGQTGSETTVIEGSGVTLEFEEGGQAGGSASCNTFGAQYEVTGSNQLSITDIVSTQMACSDEALMEQESQYLEALGTAESFEMNGESLTIRYAGGVLNFSRVTSSIPGTVNI